MLRSPSASILLGIFTINLAVQGAVFGVGPDLIVSDVSGVSQFGRVGPIGAGTIALATDSTACNVGTDPLHWFALPNVDHPLISFNLYRLKPVAGANRFEQLGYSWLKHGFGAAGPDCGGTCVPFPDLTQLGVGCSDTYLALQMADCGLAPRSIVHPFTGVFPGGGALGEGGGCAASHNFPSNNHIGHVHNSISHRLLTQEADIPLATNPNARFFAEVQYIAPHEFAANNGSQMNNASYRKIAFSGPNQTGLYQISGQGPLVAEEPAINAWVGATQSVIEPAPLVDGRAILAFEATDIGGGLWHYEYAVYNMNLDRSVGTLSIPVPAGVTLSNIGFHAPLHHPPELNADNYSDDPWTVAVAGAFISWTTDLFSTDPLANAVRFGSVYNFRFDANAPPQAVDAAVGLFKTAESLLVPAVGPSSVGLVDCNSNTLDDRCDLSCAAPACTVPGCGTSGDCTGNGIPDECEPDCDGDLVADRCEIQNLTEADCDQSGIPDVCEPGGLADCNNNSLVDRCEVAHGVSEDLDGNGNPDDCDPSGTLWYIGPCTPPSDGSADNPFCNLSQALSVAENGDTIILRDGHYSGPANREQDLTGRKLTIRSEHGPENCVLDGMSVTEEKDILRMQSGETNSTKIIGIQFQSGRIFINSASPLFQNCRLDKVWIEFGNPVFEQCALYDNIVCSPCGMTVNGGTFMGNTTCYFGTPAFRGVRMPQLRVNQQCHATVSNCLIAGQGSGTGIRVQTQSNLLVESTTITGFEQALEYPTPSSSITIRNSILWDNQTLVQGGGVTSIEYSNVQGGFPGVGNIDVDPLFVDAANGDYHLSANSPCIDAGDDGTSSAATDIDGEPRVLDDLVDMGADEYHDCNSNNAPDYQDTGGAVSADCNANIIPDECEDTALDCNGNLTWDACDLFTGFNADCNYNSIPDECDAAVVGADCDADGVPDACSPDCNRNGRRDNCDIFLGFSPDPAEDGVPDDCQIRPPLPSVSPDNYPTNRYVTFKPNNPDASAAFRITKLTAPTGVCWAGVPGPNGHAKCESAPVYRQWTEPLVRVGDCEIVPIASYEVSATVDGTIMLGSVIIDTIDQPALNQKFWGDLVASNNGNTWFGPNGFTNVNDVLGILAYINNANPKPTFQQANLQAVSSADPCVNAFVNTADLFICVRAASGDPYPFTTNPANCPVCP